MNKVRSNLLLVLFLFTIFFGDSFSQDIVINEIMSSNQTVLQDEFGDFPDWIEIYNNTDIEINLSNWHLSDDVDELDKWTFPEVTLEAGSFLLILASDRDTITSENLHTNFKLSSNGEELFLTDNSNLIVDQVSAVELDSDLSFGRLNDGEVNWVVFYVSSPGISNNSNVTYNDLSISFPAGFYTDSISLEIFSSNPSDDIYYTFDGSVPTIESLLFEEPILIEEGNSHSPNISNIPTTPIEGPWPLPQFVWKAPNANQMKIDVVRYRSFDGSIPSSEVITKSYFIDEDILDRFDYPVISVSLNSESFFNYDTGIYIPGKRFAELGWNWWPEGNYINNGGEWERFAHIELFEEDGERELSQDCGVRINGGWSAIMPQKSLRFTAYNKYGDNDFDYSFFGDPDFDSFKNFVARNSGNDFIHSHFRDAFMQGLLTDLDMEIQAYAPSVIFVNGNYWGIHGIRERYDKHYFERHFEIEEDSLMIVGVCGSVEIGDNQEYHDMTGFIENNNLEIQSNYEYIETKIDIMNFIDYNIAEIYYGNNDWPCNNNKAWKTTSPDSKWRWLIYDLDFGFAYNSSYEYNSLEDAIAVNSPFYYNCDCSTFLLRKLLENDGFEQQFVDRFAYHLNNTFQKDSVIQQLNEIVSEIENEMGYHVLRWQYPQSMEQWENEIEVMIEFATKRPCYAAEHVVSVFDLEEFGFVCDSSNYIDTNEILPFKLYPNPSNGEFYIENQKILPYRTEIEIRNMIGQQIEFLDFNFNRYEIKKIDLGNLESGVYFLIIKIEGIPYTQKLIIQ